MKKNYYEPPTIEVVEVELEGAILTDSIEGTTMDDMEPGYTI